MAVKSKINVLISGTMTPLHPETEIGQIIGLARQNSTAYTVGAVAFAGSLPSPLVLECTTAGTTGATEPDMSGAAAGGTVTDGTVVWTYKGLLSDGSANSDLSNLSSTGENHFLEQDFTIIYPNGGSESSPSSVAANTRYIEANPFPGYYVDCIAEFRYDNEWNTAGWFTWYISGGANTARGLSAGQSNDNYIIFQTSSEGVILNGAISGGTSPVIIGLNQATGFRVKVWKIGKVANNA